MLESLRRFFPRALLALFLLCGPSGPAWAVVEWFPLPAVSTSKNDGNDAGLILPILISTPEGELKRLIAPMVIHNSIVGVRVGLNVFQYGSRGQQLRFVASAAQEIERELTLHYTDPAFGQGRFSLEVDGGFKKVATTRFYGFGMDSSVDNETNYSQRNVGYAWTLGLYLNEVTQVGIKQRYRDVGQITPGATDLPFTPTVFPGVEGEQGASIFGNRAVFLYETRENRVTPTDGIRVMAFAEINLNFESDVTPVYSRYELEVQKLFPSPSKRAILLVRADIQATLGDDVPFYELSSLGGQNSLRGYGEDRFIDNNLVNVNIEQRLHVFRTRMFNVVSDFEIAPFVDGGKVFNTFTELQLFKDFAVTPGIGFRGIVRRTVVGRVDVGYSDEGGAVFAGLDYPF